MGQPHANPHLPLLMTGRERRQETPSCDDEILLVVERKGHTAWREEGRYDVGGR